MTFTEIRGRKTQRVFNKTFLDLDKGILLSGLGDCAVCEDLLPTCVNLAGKVERRKRPRKISTDNDILYLIGCETCMQYLVL
jgi:hypothetical protein